MSNIFTAYGWSDVFEVYQSSDGATWTQSGLEKQYWKIPPASGNGLYLGYTIGGMLLFSDDAAHWRPVTQYNIGGDGKDIGGLAYGNGVFVITKYDGFYSRVYSSSDCVTWTQQTVPNAGWQSVVYGSGLFVTVAWQGDARIITSPDGSNWTTQTAPNSNSWHSVAYGNGVYAAVSIAGGGTACMTSYNGVTWTARTITAKAYRSIAFCSGTFAALAADYLCTSATGSGWVAQTLDLSVWWDNCYASSEAGTPTVSSKYIDVSSGIPDGVGTEGSPFNKLQLNYYTTTSSEDYSLFTDTFKMKGQCTHPVTRAPYGTYQEPTVYWEYFMPSINSGICFEAWDLSLYGPPSWYNPRYTTGNSTDSFGMELYPVGVNPIVTLKDLVVTQCGITIEVQDYDFGYGTRTVSGIITQNSWFDFSYSLYFWTYTKNNVIWHFQGCTFLGRDYNEPWPSFGDGSTDCNYEFTDCVFVALGSLWTPSNEMRIYFDIGSHSVTFNNCYFSPNIKVYTGAFSHDLNEGAPVSGVVGNVTFVDCTFNHDFGTAFPTSLSATAEGKDEFLYTTFNLPTVTDTGILSRWVEDDYNNGLFGEPRLSVGAFYFLPSSGEPPVPPTPTGTDTTVIPGPQHANPGFVVPRVIRASNLGSDNRIYTESKYLTDQPYAQYPIVVTKTFIGPNGKQIVTRNLKYVRRRQP